jgi:hypothetical protein
MRICGGGEVGRGEKETEITEKEVGDGTDTKNK